MTHWHPSGWQSLTGGGTTDAERSARPCECPRCQQDGQHEPMCSVHDNDWRPPQVCDCPKKDERKDGGSMTENEYLMATDIARILAAKDLVKSLSARIPEAEHQQVLRTLQSWQDATFEAIHRARDATEGPGPPG